MVPKMKMLSNPSGKPSAMRFLSVASFVVAALLAVAGTLALRGAEVNGEIILYFLIAAFAPKTVQSFAENQIEKKADPVG